MDASLFMSDPRSANTSHEQMENLYRERFDCLREQYEERLRRLQSQVDRLRQDLVHDELTSALREDSSTIPYISEHVTETIFSTLANEREVFIQELTQRLAHTQMLHSNLQTLNTTARAQIHAQTERLRVLESNLEQKKSMELELEALKKRGKELENELHQTREREANFSKTTQQLQFELERLSGELDAERSARVEWEQKSSLLQAESRREAQALDIAEDQVRRLEAIVRSKEEEADKLRKKLTSVVQQMEEMLDAEANESGAALETLHDKLRRMKQRYAEDAKKHRKAVETANEEIMRMRAQLGDTRQELRICEDDKKALKQHATSVENTLEDCTKRLKTAQKDLVRYQTEVVPELQSQLKEMEAILTEREKGHERMMREQIIRARMEVERTVVEQEREKAQKREHSQCVEYEDIIEQLRLQNRTLLATLETYARMSQSHSTSAASQTRNLADLQAQDSTSALENSHLVHVIQWRQQAGEFERKVSELTEQLREAATYLSACEEELQAEHSENAQLNDLLKSKEGYCKESQAKIEQAQENILRLRKIVERLQRQLTDQNDEHTQTHVMLHQTRTEVEYLQDENHNLQSKLSEVEEELFNTRSTLDEISASREVLHERISNLEDQQMTAKNLAEAQTERIRHLEAQLRSAKESIEAEKKRSQEKQARDLAALGEMQKQFNSLCERHEQDVRTNTRHIQEKEAEALALKNAVEASNKVRLKMESQLQALIFEKSKSMGRVRLVLETRVRKMKDAQFALKSSAEANIQRFQNDMRALLQQVNQEYQREQTRHQNLVRQMQYEHQQQLDEMHVQNATLEADLARARVTTQSKASEAQVTLQDLQRKVETLEEELQNQSEFQSEAESARIKSDAKADTLKHTLDCVYECVNAVLDLPDSLRKLVFEDTGASQAILYSRMHAMISSAVENERTKVKEFMQLSMDSLQEELDLAQAAVLDERRQQDKSQHEATVQADKIAQLERRLNDLSVECESFRSKAVQAEELERSRSELVMLSELSRVEFESERKTLQNQVEEARRRMELQEQELRKETEQRVALHLQNHAQALNREKTLHDAAIGELEAKVKLEKDKKKRCVQKLQEQEERYRRDISAAEQRYADIFRRFEQVEMDFAKFRLKHSHSHTHTHTRPSTHTSPTANGAAK